MKAVFCDVCKKSTNRWYVIDVRGDASNSNVNVEDMVNNLGSFEVCTDCFNKIKKGIHENTDSVNQKINTIPTSKFKLLVEAKWIRDITGQFYCSNCGDYGVPNRTTDYCPNCGADMRR